MSKQKGFTLIELVVVMVLLGILAAYAVSRFYNFSTQANIADINGLAGALNSANVTSHGAAIATNQTGATGSITMEGQVVNMVYGYPAAATGGINASVQISSAFTFASGSPTSTFSLQNNCSVTYTQPSAANVPSVVATVTSGC